MNISSTLKSLIEEHARLDFSDFFTNLLADFQSEKYFLPARLFHPACLAILPN